MILCAARLAIVPARLGFQPRGLNIVKNRNSLNQPPPMSWRLYFRAAAGAHGEREHLCAGLSIHNFRRRIMASFDGQSLSFWQSTRRIRYRRQNCAFVDTWAALRLSCLGCWLGKAVPSIETVGKRPAVRCAPGRVFRWSTAVPFSLRG